MAEKLVSNLAFKQSLEVVVALQKSLTVVIDTVSLEDQEDIVAQGWIKVADVEPTDTVNETSSDKVWQDTAQTILQSVTVSAYAVDVTVRSSFPLITVDGNAFQLTEVTDMGHYQGTVSIVLDSGAASNIYDVAATTTTPNDATGPSDNIEITVTLPPQLQTLSFTGGYPGSQTELKAGDTFQLTGTTDRPTDGIDIQDFGAMDASLQVVAAGTTFTVTGTIADRGTTTQALAARVRARDAVTGAFGATRDTNTDGGTVDGTDLVNLNNLFPSVAFGVITYPLGQQALKSAEGATAAVTSSNFDSLIYDSPNAELTIGTSGPTSVDVTRAGGTYNVTTPNLRATANRVANDATTIVTTVVQIANVAATMGAVTPASRLRSGGNDSTSPQDHVITINTDQQLTGVPTLDEDAGGSRGTFQEPSWTAVTGTQFTRTLRVQDTDEKGVFTWSNPFITNLAGITTNFLSSGTTYELGGFVARSLTFAAFATTTNMNVAVVDYSKLTAGIFTATNQPALKQAIGTPPPVINGYDIVATGVNPTVINWLDTAAASSNSTGTAQITDVEETV